MTVPLVRADGRVYVAVVVASAGLVGLQLVLMRCLAIARWDHFAYLVISTALLGFGTSGTVLTLFGRRLARRFDGTMVTVLIALAAAVPCCFRAAEALPVDTYQVMLQVSHAGLLAAYHLILLVPFLLGAISIGLPLMACRHQVAWLYAVNMVGSGVGAAAAVGLMFVFRAEHVLWAVSTAAMVGAVAMAVGSRWRLGAWCVSGVAVIGLGVGLSGPIRVDPYKPLAHFERLAAQGEARRLAQRHSPRGRIDVFDTAMAHQTLFASPQAEPPPPQLVLAVDGGRTAPVFRIDRADQAGVMDETPMAAIYRVFRPRRVLLLGEVGGAGVWQARRLGATHITVVQPDRRIVDLLRGPLAEAAGHVLDGGDVEVVVADPRGFLDRTDQRFDLIQLTALESLAAGAPGMMALSQSYLPTVEGFGRCLDRLAPGGVVAVVRGIQEPPRDNIRLFATFVEALERRGVAEPARYVLQFRNYLAACTAATVEPLTSERIGRLGGVLESMGMDPVWFAGMTDGQANRIDPRPGPSGTGLCYLDWAARQILSPGRSAFLDDWALAVRPATDDRPFYFDFFRWRSLRTYVRTFGRHWLARVEWGYVVLIAALVWSTMVAAALILLPLLWLRRTGSGRGFRLGAGAYYVGLGTGYMLLEMALIQEFTLVLAEPVFAVAVVLAVFLVFSGLGSAWAGRRASADHAPIRPALVVIVVLATAYGVMGQRLLTSAVGWALPAQTAICLIVAAALAVPMGMPFPRGLMRLSARAPGLIPWAWGANGFASVVAAVLAVVLAMSFGFRVVVWTAVGAYLVAGLAAWRLPAVAGSVDGAGGAR